MKDFYRSPHIAFWISIPFGLILTFYSWLNPSVLNTPFLPLIGPFASWLGTEHNGLMAAISIGALLGHIGEAIYAHNLCKKANLSGSSTAMWTVRTFILGFPSLSILINWTKKNRS